MAELRQAAVAREGDDWAIRCNLCSHLIGTAVPYVVRFTDPGEEDRVTWITHLPGLTLVRPERLVPDERHGHHRSILVHSDRWGLRPGARGTGRRAIRRPRPDPTAVLREAITRDGPELVRWVGPGTPEAETGSEVEGVTEATTNTSFEAYCLNCGALNAIVIDAG